MRATEILIEEHDVILKKLGELKVILQQPLAENTASVQGAIKFIIEYADRFHHDKEEKIYFKWICEQNPMFAESGPVQCMLSEHDEGRALVQQAKAALNQFVAGDAEKEVVVKVKLRQFIDLLVAHIDKENNVLYPMADNMDQIGAGEGDKVMLPEFSRVAAEYQGKESEWSLPL